jgi:type IV pilus assembly protein PilA
MNKFLGKSKKGFTLIELMIVVAIIGILAAIAIPNFVRFQLKAKSTEGKVNLAGIRTAEEAYFSEFGSYVAAAVTPATIGGTTKRAFVEVADGGFGIIGWAPEGQVFFRYDVGVNGTGTAYIASAGANIDGDAAEQAWGYVHPAPGDDDAAGATTTAAIGGDSACAITGIAGVGDAVNVVNTVGPCVKTSGQSVF